MSRYDSTSWKRIKQDDSREEETPAVYVFLSFLLPKLRAFYVSLSGQMNYFTWNNIACNKSERKRKKESLNNNKWSDDVRWNLFTLFLLFFNFSLLAVSFFYSRDNKMSINILLLLGRCCGLLSQTCPVIHAGILDVTQLWYSIGPFAFIFLQYHRQ